MQGQRQRQVGLAMQFGVNVSAIERLVGRLRETGRLADRPRTGCPRVTTRQDRVIRLAHLRNKYVTATETANKTIGNYNRHIHPKTVRNRLREANGLVGGTCPQNFSNEAMETGLFHRRVAIQPFSSGWLTSNIPMS